MKYVCICDHVSKSWLPVSLIFCSSEMSNWLIDEMQPNTSPRNYPRGRDTLPPPQGPYMMSGGMGDGAQSDLSMSTCPPSPSKQGKTSHLVHCCKHKWNKLLLSPISIYRLLTSYHYFRHYPLKSLCCDACILSGIGHRIN